MFLGSCTSHQAITSICIQLLVKSEGIDAMNTVATFHDNNHTTYNGSNSKNHDGCIVLHHSIVIVRMQGASIQTALLQHLVRPSLP